MILKRGRAMTIKNVSLGILTVAVLATGSVWADGRHHGWEGQRDYIASDYERAPREGYGQRRERGRHERRDDGERDYYERDRPRHHHHDRQEPQYVLVQPAVQRVELCRETTRERRNVAPIFVGSVVGGLVGHQMSDGDEATTAVAAVVGTLVGYQVTQQNRRPETSHWVPCR